MILTSKKVIISTLNEVKKGNPGYKLPFIKNLSFAPKLNRDNTRIYWSDPLHKIDSTIRGLSSYPGAWTELMGDNRKIMIKIFKASIKFSRNESNSENLLLLRGKIIITHYEGILVCHEIQIPNKKR